MKLHGERWVYRIGNSVIRVDNGFAWVGFAQERMVVNDETVQSHEGWFALRQDFFEPWIVPGGEGVLKVTMLAGLMRVHCRAELDGVVIQPAETSKTTWSGPKGSWPPEEAWQPVPLKP